MRGGTTDKDRKLARLIRNYVDVAAKSLEELFSKPEDITPFMRVIPVEETINAGQKVYTYEQLSHYIEKADAIAVGHCYCYHEAYLLDNETCDAPKYRCMNFGPGALYTSQRGITRLITKEEALSILDECEESGLVHMGSNTSKYLEFLCSCCPCHCLSITNLTKTGMPSFAATSDYEAEINRENCEECGACVDICPLKAVSIESNAAVIDNLHCIGCGLCASHCSADAITMILRDDISSPPETPNDLRERIVDDLTSH